MLEQLCVFLILNILILNSDSLVAPAYQHGSFTKATDAIAMPSEVLPWHPQISKKCYSILNHAFGGFEYFNGLNIGKVR